MVGFRAVAASRDFTVDGVEILQAGWFTRADLAPYIEGGPGNEAFGLPAKLSISYRLIEDWFYER
jgi:NAD+ diphosphatase